MLIDLEQEASGRSDSAQICVLGGGIAGLILAHRLGALGHTVHLLEAGGLTLEERSQALYAAEMAATPHTGATEGRFRVFGGSSTRWGGQLLPFTEDIFRPAPGTPSAPWPIGPEAVAPYYHRVLDIMAADALPFDGPALLAALRRPAFPLAEALHLRFSKWAPFARRSLAGSLGRECLGSPNITVFTHANAVRLHQTGRRITSVTARNYSGGEFTFTADHVCVCLGTIESSRLLLASGIAAEHDQVGRYFHDHVSVRAAAIEGPARARLLDRLGPFFTGGTLHTAKLEASPALRQRESLPAVMAHIVLEEPEDSGVAAVRNLLRSLQRGNLRTALGDNLAPMLRGLGDIARLLYASKVQHRRAVSARAGVWLHIDMEQVAGLHDRIRLSASTDALNQPRAILDWRTGEPERTTARRFTAHLQTALEAAGIRDLCWLDDQPLTDTYHPMGGLRMGMDPAASVVGPDLRVHGLDNLHVASCAVFPSGGSSNPTFTMMALTLRLADHLATHHL